MRFVTAGVLQKQCVPKRVKYAIWQCRNKTQISRIPWSHRRQIVQYIIPISGMLSPSWCSPYLGKRTWEVCSIKEWIELHTLFLQNEVISQEWVLLVRSGLRFYIPKKFTMLSNVDYNSVLLLLICLQVMKLKINI